MGREGLAERPCYHNQPRAPGWLSAPTPIPGAAGLVMGPACTIPAHGRGGVPWAPCGGPSPTPLREGALSAQQGLGQQVVRRSPATSAEEERAWGLSGDQALPKGFLPQVCEPPKHLPTCGWAGWGTPGISPPTPGTLVLAGVVELLPVRHTHHLGRKVRVGLAAVRGPPGWLEQQGPRQGEHAGGQA